MRGTGPNGSGWYGWQATTKQAPRRMEDGDRQGVNQHTNGVPRPPAVIDSVRNFDRARIGSSGDRLASWRVFWCYRAVKTQKEREPWRGSHPVRQRGSEAGQVQAQGTHNPDGVSISPLQNAACEPMKTGFAGAV